MRKNFGAKTYILPMPVLIIATYDENGTPNAMNAAWGGTYDTNQICICLASDHKTTDNIKLNKEFTVSFADVNHVTEADYLGIATGKGLNKIEQAGLHVTKSENVNAPLIDEFPFAIECRVVSLKEENDTVYLIADIVNVSCDESILTNGKIDADKFIPISYNPVDNTYRAVKEIAGHAFKDGLKLRK